MAVTGCAGGTSVLQRIGTGGPTAPPRPTGTPQAMPTGTPVAGLAPPASLSAITPAPGMPPAPDAANPQAAFPSAAPVSAPVVETLAARTSSDDLASGVTPADVTAVASQFPAPSSVELLTGTIVGFGPSAVTVALTAPIARDPSVAADTTATLPGTALPAQQTFAISGATLDGVPGGFGTLRTGDAVLLIGDLAATPVTATYLTDISSIVQRVGTTSVSAPHVMAARTAGTALPGASRKRRADTGPGGATPFIMEGKTGPVPDLRISGIPIPQSVFAANVPFYSIDVKLNIIVAVGTIAVYPLELRDTSSAGSYIENVQQPLPVGVFNRASMGSATFSLNAYFAADADVVATLDPAIAAKYPSLPPSASFSVSQTLGPKLSSGNRIFPGFGLQSGSTSTLPPPGSMQPLMPVRRAGPQIDVVGELFKLFSAETPIGFGSASGVQYPIGLQLAFDGAVGGGTVDGGLSVTNASPALISSIAFAPDSATSSQGITPQAPPNTVKQNMVQFSAAPGALAFSGLVSYQTDLTVTGSGGQVPVGPVAVYSPGPYAFANAVFEPSPIEVTLTPSNQPARLCATATSGNAFLGKGDSCADGAVDFEFCRGKANPCPAEASGTSGTVAVSEPGYDGAFTVADMDASNTGCESGITETYAISVAPRSATGPSATFTVAIGDQQLDNDDTGCQILIEDATGHSAIISLQLLGGH